MILKYKLLTHNEWNVAQGRLLVKVPNADVWHLIQNTFNLRSVCPIQRSQQVKQNSETGVQRVVKVTRSEAAQAQ